MKRITIKALGVLAVFGLAGGLAAHYGSAAAQDAIKQRQEAMKANGGAMKSIKQVLESGSIDRAKVAEAGRTMNGVSTGMVALFPAGSDRGETRALPAIWQDRAKFEAAAKKLGAESAKLIEVADTGNADAIAAQFKAVGGACGGCHKAFRRKK